MKETSGARWCLGRGWQEQHLAVLWLRRVRGRPPGHETDASVDLDTTEWKIEEANG